MNKNLFIAFEGVDGCGKDTQLNNLVEILREENSPISFGNKYNTIWTTREPTKITKSGVEIAKLIRNREVGGDEATKYFIKDRCEHSKIIKGILEHSHVLSSRYDFSTFLYQTTQGQDFNEIYKMHKYNEKDGALIPDLTLVFNLPEEVAFKRLSQRNSISECFEKRDFQQKLEQNLIQTIYKLNEKDGREIVIINANQSINNVKLEMISKINNFYNKKVKNL